MGQTGTKEQFQYAIKVGNGDKTHTAIYRDAAHPDGVVYDFSEGGKGTEPDVHHMWGAFLRGARKSKNQPCLGERKKRADGTLDADYTWKTFAQVEELALSFGAGLCKLGANETLFFDDEVVAKEARFVGLMSKNRMEWHVTDLACGAHNLCTIPLYDTLGDSALQFILEQTRLTVIVAAADHFKKIMEILKLMAATPQGQYVKHVVIAGPDKVADKDLSLASAANVQVHLFDEVVQRGKASGLKPTLPCPDDLFTICYTSGTTGNPKGVVITNKTWVGGMAGTIKGPFQNRYPFEITPSDVYLSYLPLAHVYERVVTHCILSQGGRLGYYGGDVLKIVDDCKILKPTLFCSVPRLFNRINDRLTSAVKDKNVVSKQMFQTGMRSKSNSFKRSASVSDGMWDSLVFSKTKALLGGRIKVMVTGSAPIDPLIQERMSVLFCAPLLQGFGMTESCGMGFVQHPADTQVGTVGGPFACNDFRLESVPEMQYLVSDNPPRGELCLKGSNIFDGYFRNPEETKGAKDADGWLHTGDICQVTPNGAIRIIDRKKNIFKLLQGEYVAPEKIEGVYNQAPLIAQSFVFGYSTKACLIAIIVPDEAAVKKWSPKLDYQTACVKQDKALKEAIQKEMEEAAKACSLKGFEKVKDIRLHNEVFSVENDLMTPTFKIKRKPAELRFKKQIDEMYSKLE
eukprot:GHVN01056304.1.p1 GENE.GHVN01056304.1~~GHVN01056304.1.p1  ORF type:complete len:686 (+),score=98.62 GHVN01056304.1:273-2330(+)